MNCPICRETIKDTATFCPQCGKMVPRCPTCKRVLSQRMQFCKEDGTKIPESILAVFPPPVEFQIHDETTQGSARIPISGGQRSLASASAVARSMAENSKSNNRNAQSSQTQGFCVQCGKPCSTTETLCHSCKKGTPVPRDYKKNQKAVFLALTIFLVLSISAFLSYLFLHNGNVAADGDQGTELMYDSPTKESTIETSSATTKTEATEPDATNTEVTTQETLPIQLEFSGWSTSLPDYVTEEHYIVEKQQLYSYSMLETTSSIETNYMDGWEMYASADGKGDFGPWGSWTPNKVSASENRNVRTELRYRYSDRETTSSSSSSLNGWIWYDTTYAWSGYGSWSDWSTTAVSGSDSREVESKTQYRYRDVNYSTEYTDWGGWSEWQDWAVSSDALTEVESRTVWGYYYFLCPYCGVRMHGWGYCYTWAGGCGRKTDDSGWHVVWSDVSWNNAGLKDWYGTGKYYTYINGELVFKWPEGGSKTQYHYRTRSTYQQAHYGSWSGWSDTAYNSSSSREVETRTVYRYHDRSQIPTYHYYRWTAWSEFSPTPVTANSNREVETKTFYQYQDRVDQTTYYFRRWTDWSAYSEEYVEPSDTMKVETITQYRFKSK